MRSLVFEHVRQNQPEETSSEVRQDCDRSCRLTVFVSYHSEHVEAGLAQQVAQVGDGGVGGDVGGESSFSLGLGELQGAPQLVKSVPAHHRPDEHPVRLQHLVDLSRGGGGGNSYCKYTAHFLQNTSQVSCRCHKHPLKAHHS